MERREITVTDPGMRASRFPIEMRLRYRPSGEVGWTEGKTVNISRSGVLFEADELLEVDTPIEMSFDIPIEIGGAAGAGAEIACRGQVVRTILPPATDAPPAVAATIAEYRFVRK